MLAPLALGGLLSAIAFGLVELPFFFTEVLRFTSTDLRFFSLSYSLDLLARDVRSMAVLIGGAAVAAFLDPPLPLLYYELILYFLLPNKGFAFTLFYSGYSGYSVSSILLKKSNPPEASSVCSSYFTGALTSAFSGYYF